MDEEFYISGIVSEDDSERGPFAVVSSRYVDGNIMDVYGTDADNAADNAESIIAKLNTFAFLEEKFQDRSYTSLIEAVRQLKSE